MNLPDNRQDWSPTAIAGRLFNHVHMITPAKAQTILGVLGPRMDVTRLYMDGQTHELAALAAHAAAEKQRVMAVHADQSKIYRVTSTGVAVIPIRGTLVQRNGLDPYSGMTGYDGIAVKLDAAVIDDDVAAIALDIDSPGGAVSGCFDLCDAIMAARKKKPVWGILSEFAYSAAYALAAACDHVTIPRTGGAGSIGCLIMHADYSEKLEKEGIAVTMIHSGMHKVDGNPYESLSDPAAAELQGKVDQVRQLFAQQVAAGRGISVDAVLATEAACFTADQAVEMRLADEILSPAAAFAKLGEMVAGDGSDAQPDADDGNDISDAVDRLAASGPGEPANPESESDEDSLTQAEKEGTVMAGQNTDTDKAPAVQTPAAVAAATQGVDMDELRKQIAAEVAEHAQAVTTICAAAGVPKMAETMIKNGLSLDMVREIAAEAGTASSEATEISGQRAEHDPVISARSGWRAAYAKRGMLKKSAT